MVTVAPLALNVGGIDVRVWGLEHRSPNAQLAAMILLHAQEADRNQVEPIVRYILPRIRHKQSTHPCSKDLIIITFDARNHGARTVDSLANLASDKNPRHAVDTYAIQTGTALEVSHLITHLPAYLFPDSPSPRPISTWICAGVSLGGHSTWLAGAKDPRLSHLIPIIASPNYAALASTRLGGVLTAPSWPRTLDALVRSSDPVQLPHDLWAGKRILVLCGARDTLVPPEAAGTLPFVRAVTAAGAGAGLTLRVDENAGHEVTPRMLAWALDWIWEQALLPSYQYRATSSL